MIALYQNRKNSISLDPAMICSGALSGRFLSNIRSRLEFEDVRMSRWGCVMFYKQIVKSYYCHWKPFSGTRMGYGPFTVPTPLTSLPFKRERKALQPVNHVCGFA